MLGQVTNGKNLTLPDMSLREMAMFVPLIAWAIWIGVYPKPYFDILRQPVAEIVERVRPGLLRRTGGAERPRPWLPAPRARAIAGGARMNQFYTSTDHFVDHPGDHAGAVRLRHPAVRFPVFPGPAAAQVPADLRGAGGGVHRLRLCTRQHGLPGGQRRRRTDRLQRLAHGRRLRHLLQLDLPRGRADRGHGLVQVPGDRRRAPRRILRADAVRAVRHVSSWPPAPTWSRCSSAWS